MSVNSLQVRLRFAPDREYAVGELAIAGRDVVFQYAESFLGLNLAISPLRLPVQPGVQVYDGRGRMEVFGVFEDAMPDSWGRRLVDRHFQKTLGRPPGVLERLAYVGERAMGALTFHPPEEASPLPDRELDLAGLGVQAWAFRLEPDRGRASQLRRLGGTSGGARPKVLVGLPEEGEPSEPGIRPGDSDLPPGYAHWIVKFNARADGPDAGPLEFAYARWRWRPAPRCRRTGWSGPTSAVSMPFADSTARCPGAVCICTRRPASCTPTSERPNRVRHALSPHRVSDSRLCQKRELFRRASLNVLACNRDDHLKNFAFLMGPDGIWRLAPLFDFTFHTGPNGWQTLSVAGEGQNPGPEHLLKLAEQVDLRARDATGIIEQVRGALAGFNELSDRLNLSKATTQRVQSRLKEIGT